MALNIYALFRCSSISDGITRDPNVKTEQEINVNTRDEHRIMVFYITFAKFHGICISTVIQILSDHISFTYL